MALTTRCPECNMSIKLGSQRPGQVELHCPQCAHQFAVNVTSGGSIETAEPERPRLSRQQSTPTPAGSKSSSGRWLIAGGFLFVVAGLMTLTCAGIGVAWYVTKDRVPDEKQFADGLKDILDKVDRKDDRPADVKGDDGPPKDGPKIENPKNDPPANGKPKTPKYRGGRLIIPFDAVAPEERLKEIKVVQIKGKAKFIATANVNDVVITWESLKRLKYDEMSSAWQSHMVLIRDHGWSVKSGKVLTLQGDGLGFYQNFNYAMILSNLIPLTEEGFDITRGDDVDVRGKQCFEVAVKRADRLPMKLFFDKKSNLLYKAEFRGQFLDLNNRFVPQTTFVEVFFTDYQVSDGVNHWRTYEQWRDGKRYAEITLSEVKFFDRADSALFSAPGLEDKIADAMASYKDADARDSLKQTLSELGAGSGSDFARLVGAMNHADVKKRTNVRAALAIYAGLWRKNQTKEFQRGDADALATLASGNEGAALQSLGLDGITRLGPQADKALPALTRLARETRDDQLLVRIISALQVIGVRNDDVIAALAKHLDHLDDGVKDRAALALMQLGPDQLPLGRLTVLMARPNVQVRDPANKLLRQRLTSVAAKDLPELRQGLKSTVREVRIAFLEAIGSLKADGRDAAPDLTPLLGSADKETAQKAARALDGMGVLLEIAAKATDANSLAAALGQFKSQGAKSEDVLALYEKNLNHADTEVKTVAALALLELAPARLRTDRLADLMAGPNEGVRSAAGKLFREKLASVTRKDLFGLRRGLKNPTRDVRIAFIDAIASLKKDGAAATPDLADLVNGQDAEVSIHACRALESFGPAGDQAVPNLEKAVESTEKTVAIAATLALCKIEPSSKIMKTKGIALLVEDIAPDTKDMTAFLAKPLSAPSAALLLEVGEPAVAPIVKHLIGRYHLRAQATNQQPEPTASRYMGFEFLRELAKRAKTSRDANLIGALKKYQVHLKIWEGDEAKLAAQAKFAADLPAETRQLYAKTAESARQVSRAIGDLRNP